MIEAMKKILKELSEGNRTLKGIERALAKRDE